MCQTYEIKNDASKISAIVFEHHCVKVTDDTSDGIYGMQHL